MTEVLFFYKKIHAMNWVYLSSLLSIALYFKFSRFWSMRNFDLLCLILFSPGLVIVAFGMQPPPPLAPDPIIEQAGYIWLFAVSGIFLIRLLSDSMMVRRPLLEPNLSVGGMTFLGASLLVFLMVNVANSPAADLEPETIEIAPDEQEATLIRRELPGWKKHGPRYPLLALFPAIATQSLFGEEVKKDDRIESYDSRQVAAAKTIAILSHLAVVIGLILIGYRHFDNIKTGIAAAVLYLLMPYSAEMTGRVDHVLPAAFLVWAIATYRRPMVSGLFMGLAMGVIYYPLYLLPLWISFYWRRGLIRFLCGVVVMVGALIGILALYSFFYSNDFISAFWTGVREMLGIALPASDPGGFWKIAAIAPEYRLPVLALFVVIALSFSLWPAQKNLGTLMSCTAALMVAAQFWHARGGGLYMAWYLPLLLLTVFRPNLEDRVALSVLGEGWIRRKTPPTVKGGAEMAA